MMHLLALIKSINYFTAAAIIMIIKLGCCVTTAVTEGVVSFDLVENYFAGSNTGSGYHLGMDSLPFFQYQS